MSNIVNTRNLHHHFGDAPSTVHRVTFELVPPDVIEELFHAAIAVGWAAGEGEYNASGDNSADSAERLADLIDAVNKASQYTVPMEWKTDEPI